MGCSNDTQEKNENQNNSKKDNEKDIKKDNDFQNEFKDNKNIKNSEDFNNIDAFINMEEDPLKDYDYFTIDFTNCNYIFIVPEQYSNKFNSFYSNILKNSLIFFPKDSQQASEILNNHENEEGNIGDWIFICPCTELKNNIQIFHENKNIYCFIGYCPISEHDHDILFFYKFPKYHGIASDCDEIIEEFFILSNIIYYKKKFKYEIDNNVYDVLQLNYNENIFIDLKNDNSKASLIGEKLAKYFNFKVNKNKYFFGIIKSIKLLNKYLEDCSYELLCNFLGELANLFIISNGEIFGLLLSSLFFNNLLLLSLYFLNYPYFYGVLTDEEINQILSTFKPNINKFELRLNIISGFNELIDSVQILSTKIDYGMSILNEKDKLKILQRLLIKINFEIENYFKDYDPVGLSKFYQIKNYIRDINFNLGKIIFNIFIFLCKNNDLKQDILNPYMSLEKRFSYYGTYSIYLKNEKDINIENEEEAKIFNKAIRYNHTVVIGDKNFHNIIFKMKLPCKRDYIEEKEIENFFQNSKKINNKYKISKYLFLVDGKRGIEFLETIKYISNVFGIKIAVIIYIQNKNVKIDKKILQVPIIPTILTYSEKDLINYYTDINDRLREMNIYSNELIQCLINFYEIKYEFPKLEETKIIGEDDNGWDLKKNIKVSIFDLVNVNAVLGSINPDILVKNMYNVYKENNCLDLFLNYYGNYFGADLIIEKQTSTLVMAKMFIYAYTLEEPNGKSFYSIINNDFRSGNAEKICRYLSIIKIIYKLLSLNFLKSYNGDVYRATYFKKELIDKIKPGEKMFNASFWSSSKKFSIAKDFLIKSKKNILSHTKVKEGNNIDIHLEKLSQYPNEEEILFLPFCYFEIKSFKKVKENNFEYYSLDLIYCEEENKQNKIDNVELNDIEKVIH